LDQKVKIFLGTAMHVSINDKIAQVSLTAPTVQGISVLYHCGCWATCVKTIQTYRAGERSGTSEEMEQLLQYEVRCLLKLQKISDAQEAVLESNFDLSIDSPVTSIDLKLLAVAVKQDSGETSTAIADLYRLWGLEVSGGWCAMWSNVVCVVCIVFVLCVLFVVCVLFVLVVLFVLYCLYCVYCVYCVYCAYYMYLSVLSVSLVLLFVFLIVKFSHFLRVAEEKGCPEPRTFVAGVDAIEQLFSATQRIRKCPGLARSFAAGIGLP
jgi:hypothetical protein